MPFIRKYLYSKRLFWCFQKILQMWLSKTSILIYTKEWSRATYNCVNGPITLRTWGAVIVQKLQQLQEKKWSSVTQWKVNNSKVNFKYPTSRCLNHAENIEFILSSFMGKQKTHRCSSLSFLTRYEQWRTGHYKRLQMKAQLVCIGFYDT